MATKANSTPGPGAAGKKGRSSAGRTTAPGGSGKKGRTTAPGGSGTSARYTPPVPKSTRKSSPALGVTILALFVVGVAVVILNYADVLPGGVDNVWLVVAIAIIFVGLILATRYH
jgi:hypothetical protein